MWIVDVCQADRLVCGIYQVCIKANLIPNARAEMSLTKTRADITWQALLVP